MVRSPLVWLGEAEPVDTLDIARAEDPVLRALSAFLAAWRDAIGTGRERSCSTGASCHPICLEPEKTRETYEPPPAPPLLELLDVPFGHLLVGIVAHDPVAINESTSMAAKPTPQRSGTVLLVRCLPRVAIKKTQKNPKTPKTGFRDLRRLHANVPRHTNVRAPKHPTYSEGRAGSTRLFLPHLRRSDDSACPVRSRLAADDAPGPLAQIAAGRFRQTGFGYSPSYDWNTRRFRSGCRPCRS
jgi:hypothetical protein